MDLRHLRYFVAVAEEGHFGRAAKRLNIVQPALSMQIRALEEELGGDLFVRTSRKVELTQAGALFLVEAERTLKQAGRAKSVVQSSLRGEIGTVRIGFVGNAVLTGKMTTDLQKFRKRYPSAVVELHEMAPQEQSAAIIEGALDIGYSAHTGFSPSPDLSVAAVMSAPLVVMMSSDHRLADAKSLSLASLEQECFILYGIGKDVEGPLSLLRRHGFNPASVRGASSTLAVIALAASGLGVALAPETVGRLSIPGLVYRTIDDMPATGDLVLLGRQEETAGAVLAYLEVAVQA